MQYTDESVDSTSHVLFSIMMWVTHTVILFHQISRNASIRRYTREKVKYWDRIAEGPKRKHVAPAAQREHWSNTWNLKQTTAGGAGIIATTTNQAPRFAESQRMASKTCWSTERQRPTQPKISNWQWQYRSGWQGGNRQQDDESFLSPQNQRPVHSRQELR